MVCCVGLRLRCAGGESSGSVRRFTRAGGVTKVITRRFSQMALIAWNARGNRAAEMRCNQTKPKVEITHFCIQPVTEREARKPQTRTQTQTLRARTAFVTRHSTMHYRYSPVSVLLHFLLLVTCSHLSIASSPLSFRITPDQQALSPTHAPLPRKGERWLSVGG